jgi:oxygen-independent coproporphyrinogen-3 oxidase
MSAISRLGGAYSQNARGLVEYRAAIRRGELATVRGRVLDREDQLRAAVIERILCGRDVRYGELCTHFGVDVRQHLAGPLATLAQARRDGLVDLQPDGLAVTTLGRYFLRNLAMPFDAYLGRAGEAARAVPMSRAV